MLTISATSPSEEAPSWAASTRLQNYALTLSRENEERDEDSADESEGQRYRVVAAAKSTQLEIKEFVHDSTYPLHLSSATTKVC